MEIIDKIMKDQCGFIKDNEQLLEIIAIDPFYKVLIRANINRCVVPACKVIEKIKEINAEKDNYVRDISIGFSYH